MDEITELKELKEALSEYIKWFGKRETRADELLEVGKQSIDIALAMLLQKELNK